MKYESVIGLEIHAELSTRTKLFCACKNEFGALPNTNICPVCTGQPGTLPYVNREALTKAIRAALSFGCSINELSAHSRKHYFYPDLPKGYQISQRELPVGVNGRFSYLSGGEVKSVGIHQIHMEEDAGKLVHFDDGCTGVDYNRAGVPLIEIVTEPEFSCARDARNFLEAVRLRLLRAGVSDCRMEQGSLRCDVNVSLRPVGEKKLGCRVEMKNINTFSGAERAIEYEIARQMEILRRGEKVMPETRKWDDEKRESRLMRTKETAVDYKFMPEPDIPTYRITHEDMVHAGKDMPEDDVSRAERYASLGVSENDVLRLVSDVELSEFFEKCVRCEGCAKECAKLLVGDISAILAKEGILLSASKLLPDELVSLVKYIKNGEINRGSAKKILQILITDGGSAELLAKKHTDISDDEIIVKTVSEILAKNEKAVYDYKGGKVSAITFLIGQCMRALRGRADAARLREILIKKLEGYGD